MTVRGWREGRWGVPAIPSAHPELVEGWATAPLLPGAPDGFLTGGRPGATLPSPVFIGAARFKIRPVKPAQVIPVRSLVMVMAGAELGAAGDIFGPPGLAKAGGRGIRRRFRLPLPPSGAGGCGAIRLARPRNNVRLPVERPVRRLGQGSAHRNTPGRPLSQGFGANRRSGDCSPIGANQAVRLPAAGDEVNVGGSAYLESFNPLGAPLFLPGKLKNAVDADPGNAGFPFGQPALLGGDETAENAAFPVIDGIIPFVAVFAGRPGFGLGKSVGLVDAAVEGLAPVLRQGFQDGGRAILVGKGLPVGTVPGDRPALRRGCPPPPLRSLKGIGQGRLRLCVGTWLFLPDGVRGLGLLTSINPVAG